MLVVPILSLDFGVGWGGGGGVGGREGQIVFVCFVENCGIVGGRPDLRWVGESAAG